MRKTIYKINKINGRSLTSKARREAIGFYEHPSTPA